MATTTIAHGARETTLFGRFGAWISDFVAAVRDARRMAARYEHLTHLSNSELRHMGLRREDIPQAVVLGR
ncbi:MAG TPA: hypothetical protein VMR06_16225 [Dokdonella sp.]|uniref:hypothetical protein n=1 Tax=Dokdonella sp. TaxID=2291710 RepID=UPI002CEE9680|nr:hypothetical protein [Dokdonella sp.]HUD43537.1 hypothetical protein [Dokdonella sp.]